jgi:hypothetical protein
MNAGTQPKKKSAGATFLSATYVVTLLMMALTGFGQLPIYKRYYVSDIPGMAWVANYYITRYIHYIGAMVLLVLMTYAVLNYFLVNRNRERLTGYAYAKAFLMAGIVVTGVFYLIKCLPGSISSPVLVHVIDLGHMGFAALLLAVSFYTLVFRKKWTVGR